MYEFNKYKDKDRKWEELSRQIQSLVIGLLLFLGGVLLVVLIEFFRNLKG